MKKFGAIFVLSACTTAMCQGRAAPNYVIGVDIIGPNPTCPNAHIFIGSVRKISPAAKAGIGRGDQLLAIDGTPVKDFLDAAHRMTSATPQPVSVELRRNGSTRNLTVERQRSDILWSQNGLRMLDDGMLVGLDFTDGEIEETQKLNRE